MSARRNRMARVAKVAVETEAVAKTSWIEADQRVRSLDKQRETALMRAGGLADDRLPIALRSHLVGAGARHLVALAGQKVELVEEAHLRRSEFEEAATKVRSLDRLVDRLDRAERERQERRDAADLQDIVAIKAARGVES